MNLPNKITVLRLILIPFFLAFYLFDIFGEPDKYIALAIFVFASLTDWIDGYIARKNNLVTNFGKFFDPLADKLLTMSAFVAFVFTDQLGPLVVIIILSREFIITAFRTLAADQNIIIAAGKSGKAKTMFQMLLIIWILLGLTTPSAIAITNILIIVVVFLTIYSAIEYIWANKQVLKQ